MTQRHPQAGEPPALRGEVNTPALAGPGRQPALRGVQVLVRTSGAYIALVLVLLSALRIGLVQRVLRDDFLTSVAAAASRTLQLLGVPVMRTGTQILGPNGLSVSIATQCTGLDAVLLLLPAILVFPASWRAKALGVGLGLSVMAGLNFVRIVSLCYVGTYSMAALQVGHIYVWPVVVIVAALLTLLVWVERIAVPLHR
jgi:exosortase/archaeosortase family protein